MITPKTDGPASAPRCLVFGGTGALGRVVCSQLYEAGARVVFTYHEGIGEADALVSRFPGMEARSVDLSKSQGIEEIVDDVAIRFGGLDAFIHCAAVGVENHDDKPLDRFPNMDEIDVEVWDRIMAVNVRSVFLAGRALGRVMGPSGGNVVLLGSIDGVKPVPAPVHYAGSKGALLSMTRAMAKELSPQHVRVNIVVPGVFEGGISKTMPSDKRKEYLKHCSLSRFGTTEEIAALVVWLALNNTYINGESLVVDGGL